MDRAKTGRGANNVIAIDWSVSLYVPACGQLQRRHCGCGTQSGCVEGFKRELTSVQRAVDDFNNKGLSVEERKLKAIARKKEDASLKALQRVAAADLKSLEVLAKKELELEERVFKDKLQSIKDLQRAEEKATKQQIKDDDKYLKTD